MHFSLFPLLLLGGSAFVSAAPAGFIGDILRTGLVAPQGGQCGGQFWAGLTICPNDWVCVPLNSWFSSCKKADGKGCGNYAWQQCGGQLFDGETCCFGGSTCVKENDWWSYCKPSSTLHPTTTSSQTSSAPNSSSRTSPVRSSSTTPVSSSTSFASTSSSAQTTPPPSSSAAPTTTTSPSATTTSTYGVKPSVTPKPQELRLSSEWDVNAPAQRREYFFEIDARPGAPDSFNRTMLVVNGQFPGPLIEANAGDTVVVHVKNSLDFPGIQQNGTAWEDGPSGVTQCPIGPGSATPTSSPSAHRSGYYIDGITGPFIVHSSEDPLVRGVDYDVDQVVTFSDWYHTASDVIVGALNTAAGFQGTAAAPSPQSGLINGYATYNCSYAAAGEHCDQNTELLELVFPPDSKVRLRFINAGGHPLTWFSVDDHSLDIVEVDGTAIAAQTVHRIPVNVAQRYSGILDNERALSAAYDDLDPQTRVVIRIGYDEGSFTSTFPTSQDWNDLTNGSCVDWDESTAVPTIVHAAPSSATSVNSFNGSFTSTDYFKWTVNSVTYENTAYNPLLHQVWRGETIDPGRVSLLTVGNEGVDLIINNLAGAEHPFHLHNLVMFVLQRGVGTMDEATAATIQHTNLVNPIRRDTIGVPAGSYAIVRVQGNVPGLIILHCHILFHQAVGLLGALIVQPDVIRTFDIPQRSLDLCAGSNVSLIDPGRKRALPASDPRALPAIPFKTGVVTSEPGVEA